MPPDGRVFVAFDSATLDPDPTWTRLDSVSNLVTSYQIDRGRQYELDRTDAARATVEIADVDGILDPSNPDSPYVGKLEPLKQAMIGRQNPVTGEWWTRFRGFVADYDYAYDRSQRVNLLTLSLSDMFELVSAIEMLAATTDDGPAFGDDPDSDDYADQVFYSAEHVDDRIKHLLLDSFRYTADSLAVLHAFAVIFSGNVEVRSATYSNGESVMDAIQEAADAEFPGVANIYTDRLGRLCFHGRFARFDPEGTEATTTPDRWDFKEFHAADGAVAAASPPQARVRRFGFNRGLSKVINQAQALPAKAYAAVAPVAGAEHDIGTDLTASQTQDQIVEDVGSIELRGIRSWSVADLQTRNGMPASGRTTSLYETRRFARYYVENFSEPRNRITDIGFRSISSSSPDADETWRLLSEIDIADRIVVSVGGAGSSGFVGEEYFVEGIHETVRPLNPEMDDVELTLDLSPTAYYGSNPWE